MQGPTRVWELEAWLPLLWYFLTAFLFPQASCFISALSIPLDSSVPLSVSPVLPPCFPVFPQSLLFLFVSL